MAALPSFGLLVTLLPAAGRSPAAPPKGVTVHIRVEDRDGEWFDEADGWIDCVALTSGEGDPIRSRSWRGGEDERVRVHKGRFEARWPEDAVGLQLSHLVLGGRPALLACGTVDLDEVTAGGVERTARFTRPFVLEVVAAENGRPLDDVVCGDESLSMAGWAGADADPRWRSDDERPVHWQRGAPDLAPIELLVGERELLTNDPSPTLLVGAPGRVFAAVKLDFWNGGRAHLELARSGRLEVVVEGFGADAARRLSAAQPSIRPASLREFLDADPYHFELRPVLLLWRMEGPATLSPREAAKEKADEAELDWYASLSNEELAALAPDGRMPTQEELREERHRNRWPFFSTALDDDEPIVVQARPAGGDARPCATLDHLPPGRYVLACEARDGAEELDAIEVEIKPGETTEAELRAALPPDGPFVPLRAKIRFARGDPIGKFRFEWEAMALDPPRIFHTLQSREVAARADRSIEEGSLEVWQEVRLGDVRPGRWRVWERTIGLEASIDVTEDGDNQVELIAPDMADAVVHLVDADSGEAWTSPTQLLLERAGRRVTMVDDSASAFLRSRMSFHTNFAEAARGADGTFRFQIAAGPIQLRLVDPTDRDFRSSAGDPLEIVGDSTIELEPGENEIELRVRRPTVVRLAWTVTSDEARRNAMAAESRAWRHLRRARLVPLDRAGPPIWSGSSLVAPGEFLLPEPGRYRVELPPLAGWKPLRPVEAVAKQGERVVVPVTLERE